MLARVLGVGAVLAGASGVLVQVQASLNRAWNVEPDPERSGVARFVAKRLLSFAMILSIAFLLLVSLVITAAVTALAASASTLLAPGTSLAAVEVVNLGVSLVVTTGVFAMIAKVMPDARIRWRDVAAGAARAPSGPRTGLPRRCGAGVGPRRVRAPGIAGHAHGDLTPR